MIDPKDVILLFHVLKVALETINEKDMEGWTIAETKSIQDAIDSAGIAVDKLWVDLLTDEEYARIEREGRDLD